MNTKWLTPRTGHEYDCVLLLFCAFLRSYPSGKSFTATDLFGAGLSLEDAYQAIRELEKCGYIEVHHKWINGSFSLM